MAGQTLDSILADCDGSLHDKPATGAARHSMLVMFLAEFRRGMAAARRYDELRHGFPASRRADIAKLIHEEFYSAGAEHGDS